jgi:hypothetical protein
MEKSDQVRIWEEERMELIRSSGSGGIVLFWIGGVALVITGVAAWIGGANSATGFGMAASMAVLIWGAAEQSKKGSADRKIAQLDAYIEANRKARQ